MTASLLLDQEITREGTKTEKLEKRRQLEAHMARIHKPRVTQNRFLLQQMVWQTCFLFFLANWSYLYALRSYNTALVLSATPDAKMKIREALFRAKNPLQKVWQTPFADDHVFSLRPIYRLNEILSEFTTRFDKFAVPFKKNAGNPKTSEFPQIATTDDSDSISHPPGLGPFPTSSTVSSGKRPAQKDVLQPPPGFAPLPSSVADKDTEREIGNDLDVLGCYNNLVRFHNYFLYLRSDSYFNNGEFASMWSDEITPTDKKLYASIFREELLSIQRDVEGIIKTSSFQQCENVLGLGQKTGSTESHEKLSSTEMNEDSQNWFETFDSLLKSLSVVNELIQERIHHLDEFIKSVKTKKKKGKVYEIPYNDVLDMFLFASNVPLRVFPIFPNSGYISDMSEKSAVSKQLRLRMFLEQTAYLLAFNSPMDLKYGLLRDIPVEEIFTGIMSPTGHAAFWLTHKRNRDIVGFMSPILLGLVESSHPMYMIHSVPSIITEPSELVVESAIRVNSLALRDSLLELLSAWKGSVDFEGSNQRANVIESFDRITSAIIRLDNSIVGAVPLKSWANEYTTRINNFKSDSAAIPFLISTVTVFLLKLRESFIVDMNFHQVVEIEELDQLVSGLLVDDRNDQSAVLNYAVRNVLKANLDDVAELYTRANQLFVTEKSLNADEQLELCLLLRNLKAMSGFVSPDAESRTITAWKDIRNHVALGNGVDELNFLPFTVELYDFVESLSRNYGSSLSDLPSLPPSKEILGIDLSEIQNMILANTVARSNEAKRVTVFRGNSKMREISLDLLDLLVYHSYGWFPRVYLGKVDAFASQISKDPSNAVLSFPPNVASYFPDKSGVLIHPSKDILIRLFVLKSQEFDQIVPDAKQFFTGLKKDFSLERILSKIVFTQMISGVETDPSRIAVFLNAFVTFKGAIVPNPFFEGTFDMLVEGLSKTVAGQGDASLGKDCLQMSEYFAFTLRGMKVFFNALLLDLLRILNHEPNFEFSRLVQSGIDQFLDYTLAVQQVLGMINQGVPLAKSNTFIKQASAHLKNLKEIDTSYLRLKNVDFDLTSVIPRTLLQLSQLFQK